MKDILNDIVAHTHTLGNMQVIRITGTDDATTIDSLATDKSVILNAKLNTPIDEFKGVFGMANLDKLNLHLKNPEYKEGAGIRVEKALHNNEEIPSYIYFENSTGDFSNTYKFISSAVINEKLKNAVFKGATWDITFEPSVASINRLKLQSQAHSEETVFQVKTEKNNLIFFFGDPSTHTGNFIFQSNITKKLKHQWAWPVNQVLSILALSGDKTINISDLGCMMITIDSGLAVYDFIIPGQTK